MMVIHARDFSRQGGEVIESIDEIETLKILSLVFKPKKLKPDEIIESLRSFTTKNGELNLAPDLITIMIIEFSSNAKRILDMLKKFYEAKN